eukprot:TRINITY_DN7821_c0_g1_i1.p1 TRINITY_DN7821_c0_g1~~TRINITY_DN7821_c0_g1_i1.p1  ORF type:complete len:791 (-),score=146.94 TRINITY_DN7821_c0_g1_i1:553-2925(-)
MESGGNSDFPALDGTWHEIFEELTNSMSMPNAVQANAFSPASSSSSSSLSSSSSVSTASAPSMATSTKADGESEDTELFSDLVLKYINDMLMEENLDEKKCMYQECSAFQATVKPFYDILGESYPPPCSQTAETEQVPLNDYSTPDQASASHYTSSASSDSFLRQTAPGTAKDQYLGFVKPDLSFKIEDSSWIGNLFESQLRNGFESSIGLPSQASFNTVLNGDQNSQIYDIKVQPSSIHKISRPDLFSGFVPPVNGAVNRSKSSSSSEEDHTARIVNASISLNGPHVATVQNKSEQSWNDLKILQAEEDKNASEPKKREDFLNASERNKNVHRYEVDIEDRPSNKHSAVYSDNVVRTETFDEVLLCQTRNGKNFSVIQQQVLRNGTSKNSQNAESSKSSKGRRKKQGKKEMVDLRALLIRCAQSAASGDNKGAEEILKQIKQHASPYGDGSQRLAHYFAEGLLARLSGTGCQLYTMKKAVRFSAAEILKAYHLYIMSTPFKKMAHFWSNQTIMDVTEKATSVHIVDFGILYGFQWPCLIQTLGNRGGGPPRLRITGIDFPQPGFRPAERIEETGRRLKDYAESFGVPFKYKAIATKWESLKLEDLELGDSDEVLVVNCMFRMRNVMDETVVAESPRDIVLNKIREMNPKVFIHGVTNGAYNAPFFITRFREALFHYSALFDAFDATIANDHPERLVLEGEIFGREILNVVSCEGLERVERPETYKQWQGRTQRAGFAQLPLNRNILSRVRERVSQYYHKDFAVDQDNQWMLLGWKGRIVYALGTFAPAK